jgi:hypothetical protein
MITTPQGRAAIQWSAASGGASSNMHPLALPLTTRWVCVCCCRFVSGRLSICTLHVAAASPQRLPTTYQTMAASKLVQGLVLLLLLVTQSSSAPAGPRVLRHDKQIKGSYLAQYSLCTACQPHHQVWFGLQALCSLLTVLPPPAHDPPTLLLRCPAPQPAPSCLCPSHGPCH